jgi:hypothetical protein
LGAPEAWYPGHLVAESKGLYTIDLQLNPSRRVNLPIEHLRVPRHAVPLAADSIRRLQFAVPDNAINEATGEHHLAMFAQYGKLDFVEYDPATKTIVVIVSFLNTSEISNRIISHLKLFKEDFFNRVSNFFVQAVTVFGLFSDS